MYSIINLCISETIVLTHTEFQMNAVKTKNHALYTLRSFNSVNNKNNNYIIMSSKCSKK